MVYNLIVLILTLFSLPSFAIATGCLNNHPTYSCGVFPISTGRIVFHAYLSYGDGTSQIYLYKFSDNTTSQLSQPSWNIQDPMNGHFSPDGTKITFMGKQNGKWEIFQWTIGDVNPPTNLTLGRGLANEDPKYAPDGLSIYFKQDMDIKKYILADNTILPVTNDATATEDSMPYPSFDGKSLYFTKGVGAGMGVYKYTFAGGITEACDAPGDKQTYYPVATKDGYLMYSQWATTTNHADLTIFKTTCASAPMILATNDCNTDDSDPTGVNTDFNLFSGTQSGGKYKLYLGQLSYGRRWSLDMLNGVNSILINGQTPNILGADYIALP